MNESSGGWEHYRFGQEREKLRQYVTEQLNGQETKKNEQILRQFQRQAEARKHRYLHKHRISDNIQPLSMEKSKYYTIQTESPNLYSLKNSFLRRREKELAYPLIPAGKKQPPIYRYLQQLPSQQLGPFWSPAKANRQRSQLLMNSQIENDSLLHRGRSLQIDIDSNQRSWALRKIKQVAQKKKGKIEETGAQSSEGEALIKQLEAAQQNSLMQYHQFSRKLRKLRKYRMYIKQHENQYVKR